ncbi:Fe2+-dependent dioxygenase [Roseibacillus ishigakijimensis]|uniref:Fe2+-dependent dioxygenase n=1 Tax=Roseibacillus ishigakijimensis TaxID=454146 RepID=A0A934RRI9_9BACT|nr:Fe2+-dependent dioxygenase [Roseibacillus ishigakijimensis]MBK1834148.1 Fe2+-dependent dioxygenase [Roseibacillus ishigakijimensis]
MILQIPDVFPPEGVKKIRALLEQANWIDGARTAGGQAAKAKRNEQLDVHDPLAKQLGDDIRKALGSNPLFLSAALPRQILPPMFNKYAGGGTFGTHVDNAIRHIPQTGQPIRTDLSATLFFSEPESYEGGVLHIEDTYGTQEVKLPAGHLILYPSTSLHHVTPVTRGERLSSFFWIQSMVRDDMQRSLLFDLDSSIQELAMAAPQNEQVSASSVKLTGIYHNLIRQWAEV